MKNLSLDRKYRAFRYLLIIWILPLICWILGLDGQRYFWEGRGPYRRPECLGGPLSLEDEGMVVKTTNHNCLCLGGVRNEGRLNF